MGHRYLTSRTGPAEVGPGCQLSALSSLTIKIVGAICLGQQPACLRFFRVHCEFPVAEAHTKYAATSASFARPGVPLARSLAPGMGAAARHPARGFLARLSRPRRLDRNNDPKLSAEPHVQRPGTQPVRPFPLGAGDHRPFLPAKLEDSGCRFRWRQGTYRPARAWVSGGWL